MRNAEFTMFEHSKLEKVLMPNPVAMTRVGETLLLPDLNMNQATSRQSLHD